MNRRTGSILALSLLAAGLAGCFGGAKKPPPDPLALAEGQKFAAEIRRSVYGDPHIKALDMGGIGYGFGYASAEDNICEILDRMMTVTATRAKYLGPGAR